MRIVPPSSYRTSTFMRSTNFQSHLCTKMPHFPGETSPSHLKQLNRRQNRIFCQNFTQISAHKITNLSQVIFQNLSGRHHPARRMIDSQRKNQLMETSTGQKKIETFCLFLKSTTAVREGQFSLFSAPSQKFFVPPPHTNTHFETHAKKLSS